MDQFIFTKLGKESDKNVDDEKLFQLHIDWMSELFKNSFGRLDNKFELLYKAEDEFVERNCKPIYDLVKSRYELEDVVNSKLPSYYPVQKVIIDECKVNSKEDINLLKHNIAGFHRCRKIAREKSDLVKEIMEKKLRELHAALNNCLRICRVKSFQSKIQDCYLECLSTSALNIPEIEQYLTYSIQKMVEEFEKNESGFKASTLTTSYRLHHREINADIFNLYI